MLKFRNHQVRYQRSCYNILQIILIVFRAVPIASIMLFVLIFQQYIRPYIMIQAIRRYMSCVVNLLCLRTVLLLLGIFRFDCDGYRYFTRTGQVLTFRSGWVGMAAHKNVLDFLYYSYLFNPTYVLPIYVKNEQKVFYTPISFKEAFFASLSHRGFQPIFVENETQLKKIKRRKMLMQTVVSECFEELNGPILIMLPGFLPYEHVKIQKLIGMDIFQNQRKFLRSGVLFICNIEPSQKVEGRIKFGQQIGETVYINQMDLVLDCLSRLGTIKLGILAREIIKYKYQYNKETYSSFVDDFFVETGYELREISYWEYGREMDELEEMIEEKKRV